MNNFDELAKIFEDFPGIGARQARRFAYFLRSKDKSYASKISDLVSKLHDNIAVCKQCQKLFSRNGTDVCTTCASPNRDKSRLMIVHRDTDMDAIEKSNVYEGLYFILGGSIPAGAENLSQYVRFQKLMERIKKDSEENTLKEIIFALAANPDGENTERVIRENIEEICKDIVLSRLGRGLSTGTELEYADKETIKNALLRRS